MSKDDAFGLLRQLIPELLRLIIKLFPAFLGHQSLESAVHSLLFSCICLDDSHWSVHIAVSMLPRMHHVVQVGLNHSTVRRLKVIPVGTVEVMLTNHPFFLGLESIITVNSSRMQQGKAILKGEGSS